MTHPQHGLTPIEGAPKPKRVYLIEATYSDYWFLTLDEKQAESWQEGGDYKVSLYVPDSTQKDHSTPESVELELIAFAQNNLVTGEKVNLKEFGWARGGYSGKPCRDCGEPADGAKGCWRCHRCAITASVKDPPPPTVPDDKPVAWQYQHNDPLSGEPYWCDDAFQNGNRSKISRALFTHPPITETQGQWRPIESAPKDGTAILVNTPQLRV